MIDDIKYEILRLDYSKRKLREFGLIIGSVFILFSGWMHFIRELYFLPVLFCIIGGNWVFLSFASPGKLKQVYTIWMTTAFVLGWVVSRIILTIVFFVLITPIGLVLRLANKPLLDLNFEQNKKTYWIKRTEKPVHYEKMF